MGRDPHSRSLRIGVMCDPDAGVAESGRRSPDEFPRNYDRFQLDLAVVGYAAAYGIDCIVKGVRDGVDLDYEQDMAHLNRIAGGPETLFLPTDPVYSFIASSAVREFLLRGLPAEKLLPDAVADEVLAAYAKLKK